MTNPEDLSFKGVPDHKKVEAWLRDKAERFCNKWFNGDETTVGQVQAALVREFGATYLEGVADRMKAEVTETPSGEPRKKKGRTR